ncbi:putative Heat shock protein 70 family [Rosa chinensis]|uniref:Putative Heat shock protein 70 family n=1 Tax=Rosa chinensis TaxID=74649 RepID=A0A2P6P7Y2_ROSCH|nr:putative Heat shock protein 70 family [Rosa chinensis]
MNVAVPINTILHTKKEKGETNVGTGQVCMKFKVYEGESAIAKDNRLLGTFKLKGLRLAPRETSQVTLCFEIDAKGIMFVSAEEKSTRNRSQITLTNNHKGRLS